MYFAILPESCQIGRSDRDTSLGRQVVNFAGPGMHPAGAIWSYGYLTMIVVLAPAVLDSQAGAAAVDELVRSALCERTCGY